MLDYRPDLDPRTPELLVDVLDMVPTERGYKSARAKTAATAHTYSLQANEVYPNKLFATRWLSTPGGIIIAGTNQRLNVYDYTNGFINVSIAGNYSLGGSAYQYGEDGIAAFDLCAYGDTIIAVHKSVNPQSRSALDLTSGTLFADLGGSPPKAGTCCVSSNFVFLGNLAAANFGSVTVVAGTADMVAWSGIGNSTDWSVDPQVTQSSFARFTDTPGPITVVRPFRDGVVVFKGSSMYLGRYVGAGNNSPLWDFQRVSDRVGCLGHQSVIDVEGDLIFADANDIYRFDGTRPVSITYGIRDTLKGFLTDNGEYALRLGHDRTNLSVLMAVSGYTYVWNYRLNKWGKQYDNFTVPATLCQTNTDDFRVKTLSTVTAGVVSFTTSSNHSFIGTLMMGNAQPYVRHPSTSSDIGQLVTGVIGQPDKVMVLSRVNPLYHTGTSTTTLPTSATTLSVTGGRTPRVRPWNNFSALGQVTLDATNYRFNTLTIAGVANNFFQLSHICPTNHEVIGLVPVLTPAGER